jgi:hypothetical protein
MNMSFAHASSRQRRRSSVLQRFTAAVASALLLLTTLPASALTHDMGNDDRRSNRPNPPVDKKTVLDISKPANGAIVTGDKVRVSVELGRKEDRKTLRVTLNGHDITSQLSQDSCKDQFCKLTGKVDAENGLTVGSNMLRATVIGDRRNAGVVANEASRFTYHDPSQLQGGTGVATEYYEPVSVGIKTTPNGGNGSTWVAINTGNAAGVNDPVQNYPALPGSQDPTDPAYPNSPSYTMIPYADTQFPIDCPGWNYQAIFLNRSNPSQQEFATCVNSEPDMEGQFEQNQGRPLGDGDLIIFGTTPGNFAFHDLDTSSIGGTDYTKLWATNPALYPEYYIVIGVKGAAPGTAHENYLVAGTADTPYTYYPTLSGTLMADTAGHYNLIPSGEKDLQVISGANAKVQIGWQTYTPPQHGVGLFWLLVFDRMALQPINYTNGIYTPCTYASASQSCGMLFDGRGDGGAALASALSSISPRNLIVLVSLGCPFNSSSEPSAALGNAVQALGSVRYSLEALNPTSNACAYSQVSVNDNNHQDYTTAALSMSQLSSYGQIGDIHGYLAIANNGLYDIAGRDQMGMMKNGNGPVGSVDYTFEHISSQDRADWQMTDTTGHLAAYHDISFQLLKGGINEEGSNDYDVRYFYTDIDKANKIANIVNSYLGPSGSVKQSSWDSATTQEFSEVRNQLLTEINQVASAEGYLTGTDGNGGFRGYLNGSTASMLADASDVASDIATDQSKAANAQVNSNPAAWMNFTAGISSVAGLLFPEEAAFMGGVSTMLRAGSAADVLFGSTQKIPGPATPYDMRLSDLESKASDFQSEMLAQFDGAVDNILTDAYKLNTVATLTSNSNSGWNFSSLVKGDAVFNGLTEGARRSLWQQVLPSVYGVRVALGMSSTNPANFGSEVGDLDEKQYCDSVYRPENSGAVPSQAQIAYNHVGDGLTSTYDVYFLAEGKTASSGSGVHDYPISSALAQMLTTSASKTTTGLEEDGLNIPGLFLIGNSPMTYGPIALFTPGEQCFNTNTN